jgi:hypothetical protein
VRVPVVDGRWRLEDEVDRLRQRRDDVVGRRRSLLLVAVVDEDGPRAGGASRFDVAPPVADHHAGAEVDVPALRGVHEHAGSGLAARAAVGVVVRADHDLGDRQPVRHDRVHGVDLRPGAGAARDVGLVRDDDEEPTRVREPATGVAGSGEHDDILGPTGRVGASVADRGGVEHAVAVEEHGPTRRRRHHSFPARASSSIDRIDACSASRDP